MNKKHIIITGGAGFIGSHLCEKFLAAGYKVTAIDNFVTGRKENLSSVLANPNFQFLEWDVTSALPEERIEFLKSDDLAGLLHFACPASPIDFERIPFEILEVDSLGTIHTVDLALKYNARYLLASTSEIYGDPLVHPQTETYWGNVNTIGPRACYDETKRFAEAYASSAARWSLPKYRKDGRKLNLGIVRIFNTYGPRMRPDDGRVVPELCMQALKGRPLTVHGEGKQTRSFCFVDDLVDGIFKLYESSVDTPVNIGNPVERTVIDFASQVQKIVGSSLPIQYLPGRDDDPKQRCPDISKAKQYLSWEPKVSLEVGLSKTIEYFKTCLRENA